MKRLQSVHYLWLVTLAAALLFSCKKTPNEDKIPDNTDTTKVAINADTISNHLRFKNAKKITGTIPKGPRRNECCLGLLPISATKRTDGSGSE